MRQQQDGLPQGDIGTTLPSGRGRQMPSNSEDTQSTVAAVTVIAVVTYLKESMNDSQEFSTILLFFQEPIQRGDKPQVVITLQFTHPCVVRACALHARQACVIHCGHTDKLSRETRPATLRVRITSSISEVRKVGCREVRGLLRDSRDRRRNPNIPLQGMLFLPQVR